MRCCSSRFFAALRKAAFSDQMVQFLGRARRQPTRLTAGVDVGAHRRVGRIVQGRVGEPVAQRVVAVARPKSIMTQLGAGSWRRWRFPPPHRLPTAATTRQAGRRSRR